jgi:phosphocarrier protein HPr
MIAEDTFEIQNQLGMHARPSASFVKIANKYNSEIRVEYDDTIVDGKSIIGLMLLGAGIGSKIKITANGEDAQVAMEELGELINCGFNEV